MRQKVFVEKLKEAAASVLPVSAIVAGLCLVLVPVDVGLMLSFLFGSGFAGQRSSFDIGKSNMAIYMGK